ncbi:MAG TPA: hypothetical protein PKO06_13665 [Candidatus Ozemobacteraceae bacterium]|nr:hypothetical protein [Candidatus Ozemobacteraceae bacterium]
MMNAQAFHFRLTKRRANALLLSLVFAMILLQLAVSYSGLLRQSHPQSQQIDERVKMDFLAQGLIEKAILKFQLFPADFYAAHDATRVASYGANATSFYLNNWITDANLSLINFAEASSTMSNIPMNCVVSSMSLLTDFKWNREALQARAETTYLSRSQGTVSKEVVRTLQLTRQSNSP